MTLGALLKAAREETGLSQYRVAREIDARENTLYRWENGRSRVAPVELLKLMAMYGLSPEGTLNAIGEDIPRLPES